MEMEEEMTRQFIRLPFVVGAHWFLYMDEPLCGRNLPDGERGNFGLVDVVDRPYVELTAALQRVSGSMYEEHGGL